jgi:hypothetical protein
VAGPQGDQGPQGIQGEKGEFKGDQGIQGEQGPQGPTGPKGADSQEAGPKGGIGDTGPQGEPGVAATQISVSQGINTTVVKTGDDYRVSSEVGGFTKYLGQIYDGGVIFYLFKDAQGVENGLLVKMNDESNGLWSLDPNTQYNWHKPSIDELSRLYSSSYTTNMALGSALSGKYWSTSENGGVGYLYSFPEGFASTNNKATSNKIRLVKRFVLQ